MDIRDVVRSQYSAALEMLRQAVVACPESLWDAPEDQVRCWQLAYHALFFTHLYLQTALGDFHAWAKHRDSHELLDTPPAGPEQQRTPYSQAEILEYLAVCQRQVDEQTARLQPEADSGFHWLPFSKLELQIYTIRHLQHHTAELMERLGSRTHVEIDWVGSKRD